MASVPQLIRRFGHRYNVNPLAAMSVAMTEGGLSWGAVGDQGTSFGPFQLHVGGALPAGKGADWANSPAGIRYAIRQMAESGAAGLGPRKAIRSIVRNFERPYDPSLSIQRAMSFMEQLRAQGVGAGPQIGGRGFFTPATVSQRPMSALGQLGPDRAAAALQLLSGSSFPGQGGGINPAITAAIASKAGREAIPQFQVNPGSFTPFPKGGATNPNLAGLKHAQLMMALIRIAQKRGFQVGENPLVDRVDPVHTENSYHYRTFRNHPNVGRGVDINWAGPDEAARLQALFRFIQRQWGLGQFKEALLPGFTYFAGGPLQRSTYQGHAGHAHFAI